MQLRSLDDEEQNETQKSETAFFRNTFRHFGNCLCIWNKKRKNIYFFMHVRRKSNVGAFWVLFMSAEEKRKRMKWSHIFGYFNPNLCKMFGKCNQFFRCSILILLLSLSLYISLSLTRTHGILWKCSINRLAQFHDAHELWGNNWKRKVHRIVMEVSIRRTESFVVCLLFHCN